MTDTGEGQRPRTTRDAGRDTPICKRRQASAVHEVCPYLRADDAAWRSAYASREHRCAAVQPPARLTARKQRSLCLQPSHVSCATFVAARGIIEGSLPASPGDGGGSGALWPATRSTLLLLEPTQGRLASLVGGPTRTGGQAMLVGLMVIAFLVLVIARTTTPAQPGSSAGSPLAAVSASPAPSPSPIPSSTQAPASPAATSTSSSPEVSAAPSSTPAPSVRSYTVKPNDTLTSIAAALNTTVQSIELANNISDPRTLRPGQVLVIP
jgi:LysM repeat protein